ncbi:MAG: alpha/beta hydrolase, partial [Mesorhizobium sp.]
TVEWHDGGHEVQSSEIEAARRFLSATPAEGA